MNSITREKMKKLTRTKPKKEKPWISSRKSMYLLIPVVAIILSFLLPRDFSFQYFTSSLINYFEQIQEALELPSTEEIFAERKQTLINNDKLHKSKNIRRFNTTSSSLRATVKEIASTNAPALISSDQSDHWSIFEWDWKQIALDYSTTKAKVRII